MDNKLGNVSFGLPGVLYHLGNILSRFYLRVYSVHCTCVASRNHRNLYSAFFRLLWDSPTCYFSLISLCNMYVYTSASLNAVSLAQGTGLVSDAVLRAGEGCFGLAIQNDRTVQVSCRLANYGSRLRLHARALRCR